MFSKKVVLGFGVTMLLVFSTVLPALASMAPEEVKVEGIVQSVDLTAGTFTLLTEDGATVTVSAPEGFDLSTLVVGDKVEASGTAGGDDVVSASKIETQTAELEIEDESEDNDVNDDNGGNDEVEVEDESDDVNDNHGGQGEVEDDDDHGGDDNEVSESHSGSDSGSSHGGDSGSDSSHDD